MTTNVTNPESKKWNVHFDLIEACKLGDQKAQFQIYKLYYKAMYNTSLHIVKDPIEAEEIMQESFFTAFEEIESCPGTISFDAWLKKIVQNLSLDSWRKTINRQEDKRA